MPVNNLYTIDQESLMQLIGNSDIELKRIHSGNLFLMIYSLNKALIIAVKEDIHPLKEQIMLNLAHCYQENDNPEEAVNWYKKCLDEPYYVEDIMYRSILLSNLVVNLIQLNDFSAVGKYVEQLVEMKGPVKSSLKYPLLSLKYHIEAYSSFNLRSRHLEKIKKLLLESKRLYQRSNAHSLFAYLDVENEEMLGDLSNHINDFSTSLIHYKAAIELAKKYEIKKKEASIYFKISSIHERAGNIKLALENYKLHYRLTEEVCKEKSEHYSEFLLEIFSLSHAESDISQLKETNELLVNKRNTDFLTGVYNRRFWDETILYKVKNMALEASPVSILMMDVDNFKKYNDHHGHIQGDKILRKIGEVLKNSIGRDTDVVARYGGEEFVILLDATGEQGSKKVAERILDSIRDMRIQYNEAECDSIISMSIGISTGLIKTENNIHDLIRDADKALYYSKKSGKDRYTHVIDIP